MAASSARLQVLIADPDEASALRLKDLVAGEGHRVRVLADPERAVPELRGSRTHVVLLDVGPSALEAEERLQRLRALDSDLCVVATTSAPSVATAVAAIRAQAFEYLAKPIDPASLRTALARAIREKGLLVDLEQRLNGEIGRRVRARRSESRLTLRQLANRTSLSVSLISQIELGKSAASLSTLYKLARALGVPMTYFLETV